jgi:hypothetical protein
MSLMAVFAVLGLAVLVAWPVLVRQRRRRPRRLTQPRIDDRHGTP